MAKTIGQLPVATTVNTTDELVINQSGVMKRASKSNVLAGIVNADIDAAAAIAGTKISANFGDQNIQASSASASSPTLILNNTASDATGPILSLRTQRGSSAAQSGDAVGTFIGQIYDGSSFAAGAFVGILVDGAVSSGSVSGAINFATRETTGSLTSRMYIRANGRVGIGTTNPSSMLHVAGDLTVSSATTATTATAGTNGDVPAQVAGYLVVSINGTSRKIPFYAT